MTPSFMHVETLPLKEANKPKTKTKPNTKTSIVIVSKTGSLTECVVEPANETTLDELTVILSKKCGYRNHDGFRCYHTWRYKNKTKFSFPGSGSGLGSDTDAGSGTTTPKYIYVDVWAKSDGRAGYENKYEMPPPIDEIIFYGNMALVARIDDETAINLTTDLWNIIYENLFGGFEDLAATAVEDENEVDELEAVPAHKKTSNGYLKDGFIVEDDSDDKTPRCKKHIKGKGRGKKNKSESTESEFITETDTESGTPPSDSPLNSDTDHDADADLDADVDAEPDVDAIECDIVNTIVSKTVKPKRTNVKKPPSVVKSKKVVEEPVTPESETELSEEEYL